VKIFFFILLRLKFFCGGCPVIEQVQAVKSGKNFLLRILLLLFFQAYRKRVILAKKLGNTGFITTFIG